MALIPYNPFKDLEKFLGDWPEGPEGDLGRTPKVDVYETDKSIIAKFELPGANSDDIDVEVTKDLIKVEAKTEHKDEVEKKGYYKKEISEGYYKRVVPLSVEVDENKVEASYSEGVLKVVMPKLNLGNEGKGKKVKVKKS